MRNNSPWEFDSNQGVLIQQVLAGDNGFWGEDQECATVLGSYPGAKLSYDPHFTSDSQIQLGEASTEKSQNETWGEVEPPEHMPAGIAMAAARVFFIVTK